MVGRSRSPPKAKSTAGTARAARTAGSAGSEEAESPPEWQERSRQGRQEQERLHPRFDPRKRHHCFIRATKTVVEAQLSLGSPY